MKKAVILTIGLAVLTSCLALSAARDATGIDKPVWRVGDSWRVKCPVMSTKPGTKSRKIGECTVSLRVMEQSQFRGDDCYVLQVDMMDDCPNYYREPDSRVAERAYYNVNDLKLVRIEKRYKDGGLHDALNAKGGAADCRHSTV